MDSGSIFAFVFITLWCCLLVYGIVSWRKYFIVKRNERDLYKKMIVNLNDEIVLEYLEAFKISYSKISEFGNSNKHYAGQHYEDKMRQAQGYEIIKQSSNVSDSVKEQVKNLFIANGIPIKL